MIIMAKAVGPTYKLHFRRRREGVTNYASRLRLVKGKNTRMVVRKTNKQVIVQFVDFAEAGDRVVISVPSSRLKTLYDYPAKRNSPTAYLTGLYAGVEAKKKGVKNFVLDVGLHTPSKGSILFAALKGAVDAGLSTNFTEEKIIPERLDGSHLSPDAKRYFEDARKKILAH